MSAPKNILIICWDFPPNDAIGGRRWAKIAKSLLKMNCSISVIAHEPLTAKNKISWISKEALAKIKFYGCSEFFLSRWLHDYDSRFKLFKIHFAKFILKFFVKGTVFDRSILIQKKLLQLAEKAIQENKVDTVFVTGAPFNLIYYASLLKEKHPELKVLADYRDPWINAQNYGMQNLSPKNKLAELEKQNHVFEDVDYVTAPNHFLLEEIKQTYTGKKAIKSEFFTLPHAFDPDDVVIKKPTRTLEKKINIIYGGTLYLGLDPYLRFFNESVSHAKKTLSGKELHIDFFTKETNKQILFEENKDVVSFASSIGESIFDKIIDSDFILIFLTGHNKNYVTSKFYEFLPYNKPYIYVGPEGYVSQKIVRENLGFVLKTEKDLATLLNNFSLTENSLKANIQDYSFEAITKNLLMHIT